MRRFSVGRHAVAITPVATREGLNLLPRIRSRRRPSPSLCWVGCHIMLFEACTAFTFVTACLLAESPSDPLHRRLRRFRCLHRRSDCYRPEQEEAGWGLHPLKNHALHGAQRGRRKPSGLTLSLGGGGIYGTVWLRTLPRLPRRHYAPRPPGRSRIAGGGRGLVGDLRVLSDGPDLPA